jgi:hypothetical protein
MSVRKRFALEERLIAEILERLHNAQVHRNDVTLSPIESALLFEARARDHRKPDFIDTARKIGMALQTIHLSREMSVEAAVAQTALDYGVKRSTVYAARQEWEEFSRNTAEVELIDNEQTEELAREVVWRLRHAYLWR